MNRLLNNKKYQAMILIVIAFLIGALFFILNKSRSYSSSINIDYILTTDAYSYLTQESKDFIKKFFEETGEILLTEKNKKENIPYLNPQYIEYLYYINEMEKGNISPEEIRDMYEVIPDETIIDYVAPMSKALYRRMALPSTFDLRNVNGKNYVTPIKDQDSTGLCWMFATNAQAESYLLIKNNRSYHLGAQIFSEMQIDYATANNGIIDSEPKYPNSRNLGDGGMFNYAMPVLMDGLGLVDVSWRNFEEYDYKPLEKNKVYNYSNSVYEVTSTVDYPRLELSLLDLNKSEDVQTRESYLNTIKTLIMENGGAYVSTGDPSGHCSISVNGYKMIYDDTICNSAGHAMQIIGWDDDFEYSFCSQQKNANNWIYNSTNISNCPKDKIISGKGAWLLKNSWGESSNPYVYLAYDSMATSINLITGMETKDWDNNYSISTNYSGLATYNQKFDVTEKLNKIKFRATSQHHTFDIYIGTTTTNMKRYDTVTVDLPGIYTVDLSQENILIDGKLSIQVKPVGGSRPTSISLYTNNVESSAQIITEDAEYENRLTDINKYILRISSSTINIPENDLIDYKILDSKGKEITVEYSYSENKVFANEVFSVLTIDSSLVRGTYTLQTIYNGKVMDESKIKVNNDIVVTYGTGTDNDPYIINTPAQLNLIRLDRFAYYRLGQDIDLTYDTQNKNGLFYNEGKGWDPIKYSTYFSYGISPSFSQGFSGGFDGNNHKIIGLYINRPEEDAVGLFANTYNENFSDLYIKDVMIVEPNITGGNWTGSVLGYATGTTYERQINISNIQVIGGSITGKKYVGGIIGQVNSGSYLKIYGTSIDRHRFMDLYNSATISANDYAGGIFGMVTNINSYGATRSPIIIENILNKGLVKSNGYAGGLIGYIITRVDNNITINNSINTGKIQGEKYSGAITGDFDDNSEGNLYLNNIYYTNNDTMNYINDKVILTNVGKKSINDKVILTNVGKKSINDIKNKVSYNDWNDFNDHWKIETIEGITRMPVLKNINFEYTKKNNLSSKVGKTISLNDLISPKIEAANNLEYTINDKNLITSSGDGVIKLIKNGETTIHIVSYYDGYEGDIEVIIGSKSTIVFNSNGGSEVNSITSYIGQDINLPASPVKEGHKFDGWYIDNETFKNKFEFTVMPEDDIILYAKWIDLRVSVSNYTIRNDILYNIKNNTKIAEYLSNFKYASILNIKFYNQNNVLITNLDAIVGTGSRVEFYDGNTLLESYTNIVRGDITGDGLVNLSDLSKIFNYYRGNITMTDNYLLAADVTNDGNVNLGDLSKFFNYYRGNIKDI
ncbi:MAG: hypothetical protein E7167_03930 [Firmicutes bacterium]|nr:hypothetical protein [Bacillota bacterium]